MSEVTHKHKLEASKRVKFGVIVCSSSRYREFKTSGTVDDPSGDLIVGILKNAGHSIFSKEIVPDDEILISKHVGKLLGSKKVDAIIVCGGTGISPRDVTIEAVRPVLIKTLPGFGELFRKLSFEQIGSAAILTRALAGVADQGKVVFCIPGSPQAVELVLEKLILPETAHILKHAYEE